MIGHQDECAVEKCRVSTLWKSVACVAFIVIGAMPAQAQQPTVRHYCRTANPELGVMYLPPGLSDAVGACQQLAYPQPFRGRIICLYAGPPADLLVHLGGALDNPDLCTADDAQSSSGIIVSTGLGSTGWLKSIYAGWAGTTRRLLPGRQGQVGDGSFAWDANYPHYAVFAMARTGPTAVVAGSSRQLSLALYERGNIDVCGWVPRH